MTKDNNSLGRFDLNGIPPAPRGTPQIEVSFDIDANGILNVSAQDKASGKRNTIKITNDKGRLSKEDVERMVKDAERFKAEDDAQRDRVQAKNQLEQLAYQYKQAAEDAGENLPQQDKDQVKEKCREIIEWLDHNSMAEKDEIEYKSQELQKHCGPIMSKMHQQGQQQQPEGKCGGQEQARCGPSNANFGRQSGPTVEEVD